MSNARRAFAILGTLAGALTIVPAAHAGAIRYTIPDGPQYSVQDNGNGIVKLTYDACITAGERQNLAFSLVVNVTNGDGNATFNVLKEEGSAPTTVFTPGSVFLRKGEEQSFDAALAFTVDDANNAVTTFRVKLDPESGEGLGQGAGIMVRIPCVLAAPAASTSAPSKPAGGNTPAPNRPARNQAGQAVPTAGFLPVTGSSLAAGASPCVSTARRVRLRANEASFVTVRVVRNDDVLRRALVRVSFPGGSKRARTGENGTATFRVRPSRAGTLVIQSEACFGADRTNVLGARVTQRRQAARFTG